MERQEQEKFDGSDYQAWSYKMKMLLIQKGCWGAVEGTDLAEEKSQLALSYIALGLCNNQIVYVRDAATAKEAWERLKRTYENPGNATKMHLQEQLFTTKMGPGTSLKAHIEMLSMIASRLREIGCRVDDSDYALALLRSLPSSYESIIVALENMIDDLDVEDLHARLMREEARQNAREMNDNAPSGSVFAAKGKWSRITCYGCGKKGHMKKNCPNLRKGAKTQRFPGKGGIDALMAAAPETSTSEWYIDSGASHHMVADEKWLVKGSKRSCQEVEIKTGNGSTLKGSEVGTVMLSVRLVNGWKRLRIDNVLLVPGIAANLLAVSKIEAKGCTITFEENTCTIRRPHEGSPMLRVKKKNGTYKILAKPNDVYSSGRLLAVEEQTKKDSDLWHARLGHIGPDLADRILKDQNLGSETRKDADSEKAEQEPCTGCLKGKMKRVSFKAGGKRVAEKPLELIHSDVCGPMSVTSCWGARYFVTFIDDYTRATFVYGIKDKSMVYEMFLKFKAMAENMSGERIRRVRSDNGGEYTSNKLKKVFEDAGIVHETTAPYYPQQNGTAERANRTIMEKARSMMNHFDLPTSLWEDAVQVSVYLKNRTPTRILEMATPYELWTGEKPSIEHYRVFGCCAYAFEEDHKRKKLDPKAKKLVFIGYTRTDQNYRLLDWEKKRIIITPHVVFDERKSGISNAYKNEGRRPSATVIYDSQEKIGHEESTAREVMETPAENSLRIRTPEDQQADQDLRRATELLEGAQNSLNTLQTSLRDQGPRRSQRRTTVPRRLTYDNDEQDENESVYQTPHEAAENVEIAHRSVERIDRDIADTIRLVDQTMERLNRRSTRTREPPNRLTYDHGSESGDDVAAMIMLMVNEDDPKTIEDALSREDSKQWEKAIDSELSSIERNKTWELCDLPKGRMALKNRWVFRTKEKGSGPAEYKARLVAKGYTQKEGIDYSETYAPVVKLSSVRALIALGLQEGHTIHQMDVKTAFLNGDLEEETYMEQPEGFKKKGEEHKVCRLLKGLYGLKQAPRAWYKKIDPILRSVGVERSKADNGIYCGIVSKVMVRIALYVDDLLISSADVEAIEYVKRILESEFEMKDLGEVSSVLGLEIKIEEQGEKIRISQKNAIEKVLKAFKMEDCKGMKTPMEVRPLKREPDTKEFPSTLYRSAIGSMMYIMMGTRPDIAFSVGYLSKFMENPSIAEWKGVKRVFRYLQETKDIGLVYEKNTNRELVGYSDADWANAEDRKSISGQVSFFGDCLISWSSKKQATVALSTAEAETIALCEASKEMIWLQKLLLDLGTTPEGSIMNVDNQGALAIGKNQGSHGRTKHMDVKHLYVQELVEDKKLKLEYCRSEDMAADMLTKPLDGTKHWKNLRMLKLE